MKHPATLLGLFLAASVTAWPATTLDGLSGAVEVGFDRHGIPHIQAKSWEDAARTLGYLHAGERLFQMELYRRTASGTAAELFGPNLLPADIRMRQLGIRRSSQEWWDSGEVPEELRVELEAYAAGVKARVAEMKQAGTLPEMFQSVGVAPAPWHPVDSIVFFKYMAWDQSGTEDDLWFGMMVEKMGVAAAEALWPLERPYELPTVSTQASRDSGELARLDPVPDAAGAYMAALRDWGGSGWLGRGGAFGSNNWAIDGTKTKSGKPMLCSDPHLGFSLPSIWYMAHVVVGDEMVAGVTFPTAPFVVIGRNRHIAWGITNMQADSVDYFVEKVDEKDPRKYLHRGEWKTMDRIREEIPVAGQAAQIEEIDYTVHGPVINREEKVIALQWNGLGRSRDGLTTWMLNRSSNIKEALAALDQLVSPPLNMAYADAAGNIMIHPCGALPLRLRGAGRIPMDGASGEHDWSGFIPREQLPLALNPEEHFVASANGRPHPQGYPHYVGWMWDPSYRTRRIHDMLSQASDMTVEKMARLQLDAHDKAAEQFLPVLLDTMAAGNISEPYERAILDALGKWDYVCEGDTICPMAWQEWLNEYRSGVWDDEWKARSIEQPGGSWGFTGDNHREPMMEVLEFLTIEYPAAAWFDDKATPALETRDDIIRRAFDSAVKKLQSRFGDSPDALAWNKVNILRIGALTQTEEHGRVGGPVPGATFTVNPGSDGGFVGGGASYRMIIDFGDEEGSVGVYPGGQSGNPADASHYDDLMKLWADGAYVPLEGDGKFERTLSLTP